MTFNNLVPDPHPPDSAYVPRVFGFRVHRSAHRGSGGGGTVGAYSGNGRRVGGASSYAQRSMANMTSTKVTGAGSRVGTGMPMQEISNGVKDDENEGEDEKGVEDAGIGAAEEVVTTSLKPLKKEDSGDDNGLLMKRPQKMMTTGREKKARTATYPATPRSAKGVAWKQGRDSS